MKKYLLKTLGLTLCILTQFDVSAQKVKKDNTVKIDTIPVNNIKIDNKKFEPLSNVAFRKVLRGQYNFALVGSQTPTYGITLETVSPKITLKTNVYSGDRAIYNLELSGGTTDNLFKLYSSDKLNSTLKLSAGVNYALFCVNKGFFKKLNTIDKLTVNDNKQILINTAKDFSPIIDQHIIIKILFEDSLVTTKIIKTLQAAFLKKFIDYKGYKAGEIEAKKEKSVLDNAIKLMKNYATDVNIADSFDRNYDIFYKELLKPANYIKRNNLRVESLKNAKLFENASDTIPDLEIEKFKPLFNSLRIGWINFSPNVENLGYQSYEETGQTFTAKNAVKYGANLSMNLYQKSQRVKTKFFFMQLKGGINRVNSLVEKTRYNYEKTVEVKNTTNEKLSDKTTGIAYKGNIKFGLGIDVFLETYFQPFNLNNAPGFYVKAGMEYGRPWVNEFRWPVEGGLIFNVASDKKEAINLLSVIPYAGWTNIKDEKNLQDRTKTTPLHDLFEVGVKVGIPINIGK